MKKQTQRILALVCTLALTFTSLAPVFAEEELPTEQPESVAQSAPVQDEGAAQEGQVPETLEVPESTPTEGGQPEGDTAAPEAPVDTPAEDGQTQEMVVAPEDNAVANAAPDEGISAQAEDDGFTKGTESGTDYEWKLGNDGTLTIRGTKMRESWSTGSYGYSPWCENSSIRRIVIQEGIENIGGAAFYRCGNVQTVTIPSSVTTIGSSAFAACSSLMTVTIPEGVTRVPASAFNGCSNLTRVSLPNSLESIGTSAFLGCRNLKTINFPAKLQNIEDSAFYECTVLPDPILPNTLSNIGSYAFRGCMNFRNITIPESVTTINKGVFYGCHNLVSVQLPGSLLGIDDNAFNRCISLTGIAIPGQTVRIGANAFSYSGLNAAHFMGDAPTIAADAFTHVVADIYYPDEYSNSYTDNYCNNYGGALTWKRGVIPNVRPFEWTLKDDVLTIHGTYMPEWRYDGDSALRPEWYQSASRIQHIVLDFGIKEINTPAFADLSNLTDITIPNTVTEIKGGAFHSCNNLKDVYYDGTEEQWNNIGIAEGVSIRFSSSGYSDYYMNTPLSNATIHYNTFSTVEGDLYTIAVGDEGKLFAPVPAALKGQNFSWTWKSTDGSIASLDKNGTLAELQGEGNPLNSIGLSFHAKKTGTATISCTVNNNVIYTANIEVVARNTKPTTGNNDYNVPKGGDAASKYDSEYQKVEKAYATLINQVEDILKNPGKSKNISEPSIDDQANAMMENDKKAVNKYIHFNPGNAVFSDVLIPTDMKLCCYKALSEVLQESAEHEKFSLKDISLTDPIQAESQIVNKIYSYLTGSSGGGTYTYQCAGKGSAKKTVTVEIETQLDNQMGKIICYEGTEQGVIYYTAYIVPNLGNAKQKIADYLNELIDLEYSAIKEAYKSLAKDVFGTALDGLTDAKMASINKEFNKANTKSALDTLGLTSLGDVVKECASYAKEMKSLKSMLETNPTNAQGILAQVEKIRTLEVSPRDNSIKGKIKNLKNAQEKLCKVIEKLYKNDSGGFLNWLSSFKCPVSVEVYKNGTQIGYIGDDDVWSTDDSIELLLDGNAKTVYSNKNDAITFKVTGTEDGIMSHSVEELDENGSAVGRLNSYDIPVAQGQIFNGALPQNTVLKNNEQKFTLKTANGQAASTRTEYIPATESARTEISANVVPANTGSVTGTGTYVRGDAVVLRALPNEGYVLSGWYGADGSLLSTSLVYEFGADSDCTVEARFAVLDMPTKEPETIYHITFNTDGDLDSYLGITDENGRLEELPVPTREGFVFDAWYTAEEGGEKVTTDTVFTADATIYARWKEGQAAMLGDVTHDGKVNVGDLVKIKRYILGLDKEIDMAAADVTKDGKINVGDLVKIKRYILGLDKTLG